MVRGPSAPRASAPARVPAAADNSRLCRMSPSLRAFSRRCWVACSVRSPGIGSASPARARRVEAEISRSAMSSSPPKRASIKRGQSAREPARITKPVRVLSGTVSIITGSCGLSLPSSATAISTSMVAASTGAASSTRGQKDAARRAHDRQRCRRRKREGSQRHGAKAAHHRGQQNPVETGGDHHQRAHQLEEVAQQRRLDGRSRVHQVDQREAELQAHNLAGEKHHLVQQRQREAIDQADRRARPGSPRS